MSDERPRPMQADDLLAIKVAADVRLSPDGRRAAFTLTEIAPEQDEYRSAIWMAPVQGGEPRQFTRGPKRDSGPRWSPDSAWLAFLSDRDGEVPQLYVMSANGGEPRRLTWLGHAAGPAVWAPDGTRLLFAAPVPKEPPPSGKEARARWADRPRVVTSAHYKDDGQGYTFGDPSQIFVVSLEHGEVAQLTSGDRPSAAPAWSPDGARIAFSRARSGTADYHLFDIWAMNADGSDPRRLTTDVGRATSPSWSPDGSTIACYGTDEQESGAGDPMTRVWLVPSSGGPPRKLTAGYDRQVVLMARPAVTPGPVWSRDGATLTFVAADAGNIHVVRASAVDGSVRSVVAGERQVLSASAAAAPGRIAFVATDPHIPSDVYVCGWDGADERRLTRVNEALLSRLALPRVERRAFRSPQGGTLDGWLIRPSARGAQGASLVGTDAAAAQGAHAAASGGPAPLLLDIHGGPASYHGNLFSLGYFYRYVLASRGWAVLALNPTGSGSYGKAFAHGIRGRWGEGDLPEQLAAVDALVAEGIADPARLAVAGYSYGGFMTSWTITHTDRFKAAVVGAPVVNLESFHGTSDIGMWFIPWEMQGDLAAHRETYRRLSPISYVERVTTPTLILHGEADDRCPIGQGEELFVGLVAAGKAPAEFVRYPGESHLFLGTGRPSHRLDVTRRVVAWVERYVSGAPARPPADKASRPDAVQATRGGPRVPGEKPPASEGRARADHKP